MKKSNWEFLTSPSFYAMVLAALGQWLFTDGLISAGLRDFMITLGAGFIVKRTVDKTVDKMTRPVEQDQVSGQPD